MILKRFTSRNKKSNKKIIEIIVLILVVSTFFTSGSNWFGSVNAQTASNDGYCAPGLSCGNLVYHNGPVMHNARILLLFWAGPNYVSTCTQEIFDFNDCTYINDIVRFFNDACNDPYMDIAAQYSDGSGGAGRCSVYSPPGGLYNPAVYTNPLPSIVTDSDIQNEAAAFLNYLNLTPNSNTIVFVFLPYGQQQCNSTGCFLNPYCAYHSFSAGGIIYATMPDVAYGGAGCGLPTTSPNDLYADAEISATSHEFMESLTDPLISGWYYQDDSHEIGDECAFDFYNANPTTGADIQLGSNSYRIQTEWSNSNGGCTFSAINVANTATLTSNLNPSPLGQQVTFSTTVSPVSPAVGTPSGSVTFSIDGNVQTPVTLSGGTASLATSTLSSGTHSITAQYSGDSNFAPSTGPLLTQTVSGCAPPSSGDWTVSSSCTISATVTAPANVIVQSGVVLTIPNGLRLNIDFTHYHLLVKAGGGVLIKAGGSIN